MQLFINDIECDLSENSRIQITKIGNDIGDLKQKADYTNSVSLPKSAKNEFLTEYVSDLNSSSTLPYKTVSCRLIIDGIELMSNGLMYIDEVAGPEYKVMLISGNKDFTKEMADKTLQALNVTNLDHTWNVANEKALNGDIQYLLTENITETILKYSIHPTNDWAYVEKLHPSVKVRRLMADIIEACGYVPTVTSIPDNLFLFCQDTNFNDPDRVRAVWGNSLASNYYVRTAGANELTSVYPINANIIRENQGGFIGTMLFNNIETYCYNVNYNGSYTLNFLGKIVNSAGRSVTLRYASEDGTVSGTIVTSSATDINVSWSANVALTAGKKIYLYVILSPLITPSDIGVMLARGWSFGVEQQSGTTMSYVYGSNIKVSDILPKIKQIDFFKDICSLFFLIPDIDNQNKTVTLRSIQDAVNNIGVAKDWSKYFISRKSTKFSFGKWAKRNIFKYESDKETENYFGQGEVNINNDVIASEVEMFKSIFSASLEVERMTDLPFAYIPCYGAGGTGSIWKGGMKNRLILAELIGRTVSFVDSGNNVLDTTNTAYAGVFDTATNSIDFKRLIADNFDDYMQLLSKMKIINAEFYLPLIEFNSFNQFIPIYVEQLNSYFIVNKINAWEKNKSCVCELIKI